MIRSTFSSWREYLTPVSHTSTFRDTGEITPDEFVQAGDYLVYRFPTWQWSSAPPHKRRDFLPVDKQVLVTRHVPSYVRAESYLGVDEAQAGDEEVDVESDGDGDGETWTATGMAPRHSDSSAKGSTDADAEGAGSIRDESSVKELSSDEEYDDIDDLIDETAEGDDEDDDERTVAGNAQGTRGSSKHRRTYDLYIAYSTSYRVPKMYLVGFNANGSPLSPKEMFEDIVPDYRHKTATIERAPFLSNTTSVSIHPCKHATVMKILMDRAAIAQRKRQEAAARTDITKDISKLGLADSAAPPVEPDEEAWENVDSQDGVEAPVIRVDQYLVIFLKFISSVTPGIEHDNTMDAF